MPDTSIYSIPYLAPDDPPDIPAVTQGIAEAVETELARIEAEADTAAANAGAVSVQNEVATQGQTTSTSYTATLTGSTAAGVAFVAGLSGKAFISWAAGMFVQNATDSGWCAIAVKNGGTVGSGSDVLVADDARALRLKSATSLSNDQQWGASYLLTGLTPGNSYNVQEVYKHETGANALVVARQRITVVPVP